jgi:hypothetical protein
MSDLTDKMIAAGENADYGDNDNEYVRNVLAAALRVLEEHEIVFVHKGHLGPSHTPQPLDLICDIEAAS